MNIRHAQWAQLVLGAWLIISPWLLGFSAITAMKWGNVLVGLALVVSNLWALYGTREK